MPAGNVVERVRSISHRMGLSQYDIAKSFKVSQANVSKILGGRVGLTPKMKIKFEQGLADLRQRRENLASGASKTASRPGPKPGRKATKNEQPGEARAMSPNGLKGIIEKMLAGTMTGVVILGSPAKIKRAATSTRKVRAKTTPRKTAKRATSGRRRIVRQAAAPSEPVATPPVNQVEQPSAPASPEQPNQAQN